MPFLFALLRAEPHLGRNFIEPGAAAAAARGQGLQTHDIPLVTEADSLARALDQVRLSKIPRTCSGKPHRQKKMTCTGVCTKAHEAADNGQQQVISQNR